MEEGKSPIGGGSVGYFTEAVVAEPASRHHQYWEPNRGCTLPAPPATPAAIATVNKHNALPNSCHQRLFCPKYFHVINFSVLVVHTVCWLHGDLLMVLGDGAKSHT